MVVDPSVYQQGQFRQLATLNEQAQDSLNYLRQKDEATNQYLQMKNETDLLHNFVQTARTPQGGIDMNRAMPAALALSTTRFAPILEAFSGMQAIQQRNEQLANARIEAMARAEEAKAATTTAQAAAQKESYFNVAPATTVLQLPPPGSPSGTPLKKVGENTNMPTMIYRTQMQGQQQDKTKFNTIQNDYQGAVGKVHQLLQRNGIDPDVYFSSSPDQQKKMLPTMLPKNISQYSPNYKTMQQQIQQNRQVLGDYGDKQGKYRSEAEAQGITPVFEEDNAAARLKAKQDAAKTQSSTGATNQIQQGGGGYFGSPSVKPAPQDSTQDNDFR